MSPVEVKKIKDLFLFAQVVVKTENMIIFCFAEVLKRVPHVQQHAYFSWFDQSRS